MHCLDHRAQTPTDFQADNAKGGSSREARSEYSALNALYHDDPGGAANEVSDDLEIGGERTGDISLGGTLETCQGASIQQSVLEELCHHLESLVPDLKWRISPRDVKSVSAPSQLSDGSGGVTDHQLCSIGLEIKGRAVFLDEVGSGSVSLHENHRPGASREGLEPYRTGAGKKVEEA